jgi:hypothetical protein
MRQHLLMALLCVSAFPAFAGQEIGNGTDDYKAKSHAWFTQASDISVCLDLKPDAGLSEAKMMGVLTRSFNAWSEFINSNRHLQADDTISKLKVRFESCSAKISLRFIMGGLPPEIRHAKSLGSKAFAMPVLQSFNKTTFSGRGYIWIAGKSNLPTYMNWSNEEQIQSVVMHEIGHVLGIGHVAGTIMDANLSELIEETMSGNSHHLISINMRRELIVDDLVRHYTPERFCPKELVDGYVYTTSDVEPYGFANAYRQLLNRTPILDLRTSIQLVDHCNTLRFKDPSGVSDFRVSLGSYLEAAEIGAPRFVPFRTPGGDWAPLSDLGYLRIGTVENHSGERFQIVFKRNKDISYSIELIDQNQAHPLFRSKNAYHNFRGAR